MEVETRTAYVVDDEPLARLLLRDLLSTTDWIEWAGEAGSVAAAREGLKKLRPDVVFLDISLPGESGLNLANELSSRVAIVFTTAFEQYAIRAFDLGAADYLLKPFGKERFDKAVGRLRERLEREGPERSPYVNHLFARSGDATFCIPVSEVDRFEARDDYIEVHHGVSSHLVHMRMSVLEERLDPERFQRVHRSHIVNWERVLKIVRERGAAEAHLRDGAVVPISRSRLAGLRIRNSEP